MRLVYVAGPYRGLTPEDVDLNIAAATQVGKLIARHGDYPVIPHLNTRHFERFSGLPDTFFLEGTLELLRRCDAVVLCPGYSASSGTREEIAEAERLHLPVYETVEDLLGWDLISGKSLNGPPPDWGVPVYVRGPGDA